MTRSIAALLIFLAGIALCRSGYLRLHEREDLPENSGIGEIVAHSVAIDRARWNGGKQNCIAVETRVHSGTGDSASRRFFANAESAWEFALKHPVGERVDVSKLGNGDEVASTGGQVLGGLGMILCGGLVAVLGLALATKGDSLASRFGALAFSVVFLWGGVSAASSMWGEAIDHVCAAWWAPVACEVFEDRRVRSGKHGSKQEFAFRYSFKGVSYENVAKEFPFTNQRSRPIECHMNPDAPWRSRLTWGFRPALLIVLFPLPFLALGFSVLAAVLFPSIGRWLEKAGSRSKLWKAIADYGSGAVVVGSFVGLVVGGCGELWLAGAPGKWISVLLLIPIVIFVRSNAKRRARKK